MIAATYSSGLAEGGTAAKVASSSSNMIVRLVCVPMWPNRKPASRAVLRPGVVAVHNLMVSGPQIGDSGSGIHMVAAILAALAFWRSWTTNFYAPESFAGVSGLNLWSMLVAVIGAVVVLVIYHSVAGRRIA